MEPLPQKGVDVRAIRDVGMIDALPWQRGRGFVAVGGTEVGVAEEEEQVLKILHPALHEVGEDRFNLDRGYSAGGNQVLVPFLVTGAGDEGSPFAPAKPYEGVESLRHGPLTAKGGGAPRLQIGPRRP